MALSLLVWFPLDTGYSLAHHVWINAVGNPVILALLAVPLLMVRLDAVGLETVASAMSQPMAPSAIEEKVTKGFR